MRKNITVKRTLALTMAVLMGASLAGCGSKGGDGGSKVKEDGTIDTSSHEVINMLVLGNKPSNGRCEAMLKELNKVLTDKVNAELEGADHGGAEFWTEKMCNLAHEFIQYCLNR